MWVHKIHVNEINSKNRVSKYYFGNLVRANIIKTKTIFINEKN